MSHVHKDADRDWQVGGGQRDLPLRPNVGQRVVAGIDTATWRRRRPALVHHNATAAATGTSATAMPVQMYNTRKMLT